MWLWLTKEVWLQVRLEHVNSKHFSFFWAVAENSSSLMMLFPKVNPAFEIRRKLQILHLFTKQTLHNIFPLIATLMSRKQAGWARKSCDSPVQFHSFTTFLPKQRAGFLFLSPFLCFSTNRSNYHEPHISEQHGTASPPPFPGRAKLRAQLQVKIGDWTRNENPFASRQTDGWTQLESGQAVKSVTLLHARRQLIWPRREQRNWF